MTVQYVAIAATEVTGTGGSEQTLLTAPGAGNTRVTLYATNHSSGAESITVHSVPSAGSAADGNQIVSGVAIGVGSDPKLLTADLVVSAGSTVQLSATGANDLNVYGYYRVIT